MGKSLVIVESPSKARTVRKYLGPDFTVKASVGHVKDLPKSRMGVDVEDGFKPEYVTIKGKGRVLTEIRKAAREADRVFLASDPDREGEAIAWHIAGEIAKVNPNIKRVLFNEITKSGVARAIEDPVDLDQEKFASQKARRILDRLVGYEISPILWKKVRRGLSAGRVQSVAVRMIVDREREIRAFVPEEYWTIAASVRTPEDAPLDLRLVALDGKKAKLGSKAEVDPVVERLRGATYRVTSVVRKERKRRPLAPFITSKLQQEAARKLRFSPKRTMGLAQRLYEGVDLGGEGAVGLITYMRTDSTRLSDDAVGQARGYIGQRFGADYLPARPNVFKSKKKAQDAHEAIRPTDVKYDPATVERLLVEPARRAGGDKLREARDLHRLYTLIWQRFVACQMTPAIYDQTTVEVDAAGATLRATGQVLRFDGYRRAYEEAEEENGGREGDRLLPRVEEGWELAFEDVKPEQHFTQPPPRYTEASLIKELEEQGIGRPSTYASILSTIQDREYVERVEGRLRPTDLGELVNDLLCASFPHIVSAEFTAKMEEGLDRVEEGQEDWVKLLSRFYTDFAEEVARAKVEMRDVRREETPTDHVCDKCGSPMVIKWGRNGRFLACSNFPTCKNPKEFRITDDGKVEVIEAKESGESCESCGAPMVIKRGRFGEFLACSRYPECKTTKPLSLGVDCPKPGCDGFLTEKRSRRGRVFYGCSNYNKTGCDFVTWDRPVPHACPQCGTPFLLVKKGRQGRQRLYCHDKSCGYSVDDWRGPDADTGKNGERREAGGGERHGTAGGASRDAEAAR